MITHLRSSELMAPRSIRSTVTGSFFRVAYDIFAD
jgi:hypothetical protein